MNNSIDLNNSNNNIIIQDSNGNNINISIGQIISQYTSNNREEVTSFSNRIEELKEQILLLLKNLN
jgi:polyhydroxyalkanoate synthesis regulator phasin